MRFGGTNSVLLSDLTGGQVEPGPTLIALLNASGNPFRVLVSPQENTFTITDILPSPLQSPLIDANGVISSFTANTSFSGNSATIRGPVPIISATPTDNAFVVGVRPAPANVTTPILLQYQSLDLRSGSTFTLGSNETLNLNDGTGTLSISPGAIFYGNGSILGNIFNQGLLIIPITRAGIIVATRGGVVRVTPPVLPEPPTPITPIAIEPVTPPVIQPNTLIQIGGSGFSAAGGGGGGGGGGSGGGSYYRINSNTVTLQGTATWDGRLDVTGSFTQSITGVLRLFIAGDVQGETYSQLNIGQAANISGGLQIVLQPELYNYLPSIGDSFDIITAAGGITLPTPPATLTVTSLMTRAGAEQLGLSLPTFNSGFADDPNQLVSLPSNVFTYSLLPDGKTLRITLMQPVCGTVAAIANNFVCADAVATFTASTAGSGPYTYQWRVKGRNGLPPADWVDIVNGENVLPVVGTPLFSASGSTARTLTLDRDALGGWPFAGLASALDVQCVVNSPCGITTPQGQFGVLGTRCSPADIARDDGQALPPIGPCSSSVVNNGVTEGDYNLFFSEFFDGLLTCDIADDSGQPLPPFGSGGIPPFVNNGVTEGDYNLFFSLFFDGCP